MPPITGYLAHRHHIVDRSEYAHSRYHSKLLREYTDAQRNSTIVLARVVERGCVTRVGTLGVDADGRRRGRGRYGGAEEVDVDPRQDYRARLGTGKDGDRERTRRTFVIGPRVVVSPDDETFVYPCEQAHGRVCEGVR